ncbi:hypothetical protein C8R43DRAFT_1102485 [Mycena crocata]|nr:hypothetical protein C8R43DRAFT_1102485 [Mycena crocata]
MAAVNTSTVAYMMGAIVAKTHRIATLKVERAAWKSRLEVLRARYLEELQEVEDLEVELALLVPEVAPAPVVPAPVVPALKRQAASAIDLEAASEPPTKKAKVRADGKENKVAAAPVTRSRSRLDKKVVLEGML